MTRAWAAYGGISTVLTTYNRADFSSNDLLFFCYPRNNVITGLVHFTCSGLLSTRHLESRSHKTKIKRAKRPCVYYSNSSATFHCLLEGDLVFKLNPGPLNNGYEQSSARRFSRNSSNLITVHRQPYSGNHNAPSSLCLINSPSASSLKFCLLNSRSVRNKTGDLVDYISHDCKPDIVAITESWLGQHDDAVHVELCPEGYNLLDHTRKKRRGGGTALLFRDSVCVHKIDAGNRTSYEFSEWLIYLTSAEKMRVTVVYRPPYSGEHKVPTSVFFDEFSAYLESLLLCKERLLICGDFNIHVDSVDDPDSVKFRDLLESVGLQQHVKKSTHNNGHILDLIITRFTDSTICKEPQVDRFISHHASVICHVLASRPSKARRKITYRKLNSVDTDKLRRDVAASVLCDAVRVDPEDLPVGEIDNLVREYNMTLKNITDHHAPLKIKVLRARPSSPWYSAEIDAAKRRRRKAERAWRKNKSEASFKLFLKDPEELCHSPN